MVHARHRAFRAAFVWVIVLASTASLDQRVSHAEAGEASTGGGEMAAEALTGAAMLQTTPKDAPDSEAATLGAGEQPGDAPADEGEPPASHLPNGREIRTPASEAHLTPPLGETAVPDSGPGTQPAAGLNAGRGNTSALAVPFLAPARVASAREQQVLGALEQLRAAGPGARRNARQEEDLRQRMTLWRSEVEALATSGARQLSDLKTAQRLLRSDLRTLPWKTRRRDISVSQARRSREDADAQRAAYDDLYGELRAASEKIEARLPVYRQAAKAASEARLSREITRDLSSIVAESEKGMARLREAKRVASENAELAADLTKALDPAIDAAEAASLLRRSQVHVTALTPAVAMRDLAMLGGWLVRSVSGRASESEFSIWRDAVSPLGLVGNASAILLAAIVLVLLGRRLRLAITLEAERRMVGVSEEEVARATWRLNRWINIARAGVVLLLLHLALKMLPLEPRVLRSSLNTVDIWCSCLAALAGLRLLVASSPPGFRLLACPDAAARHVYSVTVAALLISAMMLPAISALGLFDYPQADVRVLVKLLYGAALVALFVRLINGRETSAMLCTRAAGAGSADLQGWVAVVRPAVSLAAVALLAASVAGYLNLAAYVARGVILTATASGVLVALQQRLARELEARFPTTAQPPDADGRPVLPDPWAVPAKYAQRALAALAALYLLARIWGAKGYHIAWVISCASRPLIDVKGTKVSILGIMQGLAVLLVSYWLARLLQKRMNSSAWISAKWDEGAKHAIASTVYYLVLIGGAMVAIVVAGMQLTVLAAFAGMVGIAVGFGSQDIAKNIICGLIIMMDRAINVGDYVDVAGQSGTITDIGIRSTTIRTMDNRFVVVPNATFYTQNVVVSSQRERRVRILVELAVAGDSDLAEVSRMLVGTAKNAEGVLSQPSPEVSLSKLAPAALNLQLVAWTDQIDQVPKVHGELVGAIWSALKENGVTLV